MNAGPIMKIRRPGSGSCRPTPPSAPSSDDPVRMEKFGPGGAARWSRSQDEHPHQRAVRPCLGRADVAADHQLFVSRGCPPMLRVSPIVARCATSEPPATCNGSGGKVEPRTRPTLVVVGPLRSQGRHPRTQSSAVRAMCPGNLAPRPFRVVRGSSCCFSVIGYIGGPADIAQR